MSPEAPVDTVEQAPTPAGSPAACTPAARAPQFLIVLAFVTLIALVPLGQWAMDLRRGEGSRLFQVFRQQPTSKNLRAYERTLEDESGFARALRPIMQYVHFAWLGDGGEKALVGRDGWLFYKPGFNETVARQNPVQATDDPVAAIVAFRDALRARGIRLLVLPAPNKEGIYPDRLSARAPVGQELLSPVTRDLLKRLDVAGVDTVDLFALYGDARRRQQGPEAPALYLVQDSHWSPAGISLAAAAVANRLKELAWLHPGTVVFEERVTPVERLGDVLRMLQLPTVEKRTSPEKIACRQVVRPGGELYRDDPQSEVLVLGDSFLRIFEQDEPGSAGFIAHLARELGQPVASLVSDGGASTLVRQELFRRPALLRNKRVVIWEFVERDLRLGTEGWQVVPLPPETGNASL